MVSTRKHPKDFPEPDLSPTKASPRATRKAKAAWAHSPSNLVLVWLAVSLPLVLWDAGYVLLRPHSMPGGKYHWPLWVPYELYGRTDYIYGWKAYNEKNGFTAAQTVMNLIETVGYVTYLGLILKFGKQSVAHGRGAPKNAGWLGQERSLTGDKAAYAALVAYSSAILTVAKTMLYWLNEYYSGFGNIGHNTLPDLILLWIIPNGAWLVLPAYISYIMGSEILEGLAIAAGSAKSENDVKAE
ncbi:hypothetical protein V502_09008 [Pseudogymnoascus sp. VKM F-4520 (FW-2644)]|nr:hypothetical protein V502_09008 [Pseudogymnoascus sp. VKM F-4520 (FW-2644)]